MFRNRSLLTATLPLLFCLCHTAPAQQAPTLPDLPAPLSAEQYAALMPLSVNRMQPRRYIRIGTEQPFDSLRRRLPSLENVPADSFALIADTSYRTAYDEQHQGVLLHIVNRLREKVCLQIYDNGSVGPDVRSHYELHVVMEARDPWGNWKAIEYVAVRNLLGCHQDWFRHEALHRNHAISMIAPRYAGSFRTELRFKVRFSNLMSYPEGLGLRHDNPVRYSNTFAGGVDPAQFGVRPDFSPRYHTLSAHGPAPSWYSSGLIDSTGTFVIPPIHNRICTMSNGLLAVYHNGKWGILDHRNNVVVPPLYDLMEPLRDGMIAVNRGASWDLNAMPNGGTWEILDSTGAGLKSYERSLPYEIVARAITAQRLDISAPGIELELKSMIGNGFTYPWALSGFAERGLTMISARDSATGRRRYGLEDREGNTLVQPIMEYFEGYSEGLWGFRMGEQWGFIDTAGILRVRPEFDATSNFSNGLAAVCLDDKWGYIDRSGTVVIPFRFDEAYSFNDDYATVTVDSLYGIIDREGRYVIPPKYPRRPNSFGHRTCRFIKGSCLLRTDSNAYVIDINERIIAGPYHTITRDITLFGNLSEGIFLGNPEGYYLSSDSRGNRGLIRPDGHVVSEPKWKDIHPLTPNLIVAFDHDSTYSILDRNGNVKGTPRTGTIDRMPDPASTDGMIRIRRDGFYGFIDTAGTEVIPPQFVDALPFAYGRAVVMIDRRYGAIDRSGEIVIPPSYEFIYPFRDGTAVVVIRQDDSDR